MNNNLKKLIGHASGLVTVSVVLVVSVVALFITNVGFGWMAKATHAGANGMLVGVDNPGSPVYSYEMYYVFDAEVTTGDDDSTVHTYYFAKLGTGESAEMALKNYSKLEAPKYHLLLHVSINKDVADSDHIYVDLHNNAPNITNYFGSYGNNAYTIDVSNDDTGLGKNFTNKMLGLSSALEFYVMGSDSQITWESSHKRVDRNDAGEPIGETVAEDIFVFQNSNLPAESATFAHTEGTDSITYTGVTAPDKDPTHPLCISAGDLGHVAKYNADDPSTETGDEYKDLFVFMTYSAELVALLHNAVAGSTEDAASADFSFVSDVFLLIRKDYQ